MVKGTNRAGDLRRPAQRQLAPGVDLQRRCGLEAARRRDHRRTQAGGLVPRAGPTGPMTWHAKALQTSYLSRPRSGTHTAKKTTRRSRITTTSWYFLDAVDVMAPCEHGRRMRVRRFDHRRDAVDAERRRSLARRVVAPASRALRQPRVGGERRDRRQSNTDARKLSAASAVPRAGRRRCSGSTAISSGLSGRLGGRAAGRHQRHQRGRIGRRDHRRHERARVARQSEGDQDCRRDDHAIADGQRQLRHARRERAPAGGEYLHPHGRGLRCALPTSTQRRSIRRQARSAKSSSRTAPSAAPAIGCTRTVPGIRRWDRRLT